MTSELFEEWVWKHDCMFRDKARNIALLLDNIALPSSSWCFKSNQHEARISSHQHDVRTPTDGPRGY